MADIVSLLIGIIIGLLLSIAIDISNTPEISYEEIYRFCLSKNISLDECKIPPKPYKKEINRERQ